MAASHSAVVTSGNSESARISPQISVSGMAAPLHPRDQVTERRPPRGLGTPEKPPRSARSLPRSTIDDLESATAEIVERRLDTGPTQRTVPQPAASAVLLDLLRHR